MGSEGGRGVGLEGLIPIINKLHDVFAEVGSQVVDLPQIAVVGAQSSGKSSVLEAFVGRDFLPRGNGIVTRRPLVLQMIHVDDPRARDVGEFAHKPGVKFTDFNAVCQEIIDETERVCPGKQISPAPINLRLWSPNVLNLTLVDLPGLTKVATEGQDPRIVEDIERMVHSVVSRPSCLILAVSPANQDLATSDALNLARRVDPSGDRTLGVVTKIDTLEPGVNCREVLENRVYPLKLGYVGVVNRSVGQLRARVPALEARKLEREFFDNSRDYTDLADRCGSQYLCQVLSRLLMEHVRSCLPALRASIQGKLLEKEAELAGYGENPNISAGTQSMFVLDVITKYLDLYQDLLHGRAPAEMSENGRKGGARISRVFNDEYGPALDKCPGLKAFTEKEFFIMMKNHAGLTVPLFTPHKAFDVILGRAIEQLREPSVTLVDTIVSVLFEIHGQVGFMELTRFTALNDMIRACVDQCVRACAMPARAYVSALIDNEKSFINTLRPDFRSVQVIETGRSEDPRARPLPERPAVPDPVSVCSVYGTSKDMTTHQSQELKDLIQIGTRYFDLIRDQIRDVVPKAVVKFVVEESGRNLRPALVKAIFAEGSVLGELLSEDQGITKKRIACKNVVEALKRASEILNEVRVFQT